MENINDIILKIENRVFELEKKKINILSRIFGSKYEDILSGRSEISIFGAGVVGMELQFLLQQYGIYIKSFFCTSENENISKTRVEILNFEEYIVVPDLFISSRCQA